MSFNHMRFRLRKSGSSESIHDKIYTVSGKYYNYTGTKNFLDGNATDAYFCRPTAIIGNFSRINLIPSKFFVTDSLNNRIRQLDTSGNVTTYAGDGSASSIDGVGQSASFNNPRSLVISSDNSYLYVAEPNKIRKVTNYGGNTGVVTTLASGFSNITSISIYEGPTEDIIYVTDNHYIKKVTLGGTVTIIAGGLSSGDVNSSWANSRFNYPKVYIERLEGRIYIADTYNHKIKELASDGNVYTLTGTGVAGNYNNGRQSTFDHPMGILASVNGQIYIGEGFNGSSTIRQIANIGYPSDNYINLTVGTVSDGYGYQDGDLIRNGSFYAQTSNISNFFEAYEIINGSVLYVIYFADTYNNVIRKIIT